MNDFHIDGERPRFQVLRYEDATDRCPDCSAIVPQPEPLEGGGTIGRPVQHMPWCPFQRRAQGQIIDPAGAAAVPLPEPGPIWTNGLAEDDDDPAEPLGYTPRDLESAQQSYAAALEHYDPTSRYTYLLAYVTGGARRGPVAAHQLAMMAVIDKEWTSK